jgi:hypothetical protein
MTTVEISPAAYMCGGPPHFWDIGLMRCFLGRMNLGVPSRSHLTPPKPHAAASQGRRCPRLRFLVALSPKTQLCFRRGTGAEQSGACGVILSSFLTSIHIGELPATKFYPSQSRNDSDQDEVAHPLPPRLFVLLFLLPSLSRLCSSGKSQQSAAKPFVARQDRGTTERPSCRQATDDTRE